MRNELLIEIKDKYINGVRCTLRYKRGIIEYGSFSGPDFENLLDEHDAWLNNELMTYTGNRKILDYIELDHNGDIIWMCLTEFEFEEALVKLSALPCDTYESIKSFFKGYGAICRNH